MQTHFNEALDGLIGAPILLLSQSFDSGIDLRGNRDTSPHILFWSSSSLAVSHWHATSLHQYAPKCSRSKLGIVVGDAWVFVAMDAESQLIPSYVVGRRDRTTTYQFLTDLRDRMAEEHRFADCD